jgi:DNA-binding protein H-NS
MQEMPQTYADIQQQIARLQSEAESLRAAEAADVVARIKDAIATYGLTPQDLFGGRARAGARSQQRGARTPKYADGKGGVWGGRGPRPQWLRAALAAGKRLEDFAVDGGSARSGGGGGAAPARVKGGGRKAAGKKGGRAGYTDGTNTWSGFGRKPRWLVDALAAGKSLDDLRA